MNIDQRVRLLLTIRITVYGRPHADAVDIKNGPPFAHTLKRHVVTLISVITFDNGFVILSLLGY
jgi:hypothetical protein